MIFLTYGDGMSILDTIRYKGKIIIAGPCALESRAQLKNCVKQLKDSGIMAFRACLWKPRTAPGWEGLGYWGLYYLLEETLPHGLTPATEIITAEQAKLLLKGLRSYGDDAKMIVWIGSRNQNHFEQKEMARVLSEAPNVIFMFKNQMWEDQKHWLGIYNHIITAGFPKDNLMTCHRGFAPGHFDNPEKYRNLPHFEMAVQVRESTGIPMLLDPSHIGGSVSNVYKIINEASRHNFDGFMIEVHDNVQGAKTDANQQLTIDQFRELIPLLVGDVQSAYINR